MRRAETTFCTDMETSWSDWAMASGVQFRRTRRRVTCSVLRPLASICSTTKSVPVSLTPVVRIWSAGGATLTAGSRPRRHRARTDGPGDGPAWPQVHRSRPQVARHEDRPGEPGRVLPRASARGVPPGTRCRSERGSSVEKVAGDVVNPLLHYLTDTTSYRLTYARDDRPSSHLCGAFHDGVQAGTEFRAPPPDTSQAAKRSAP